MSEELPKSFSEFWDARNLGSWDANTQKAMRLLAEMAWDGALLVLYEKIIDDHPDAARVLIENYPELKT